MKKIGFIISATSLLLFACGSSKKTTNKTDDRLYYNASLSEKENLALQNFFFEGEKAKLTENPEKALESFLKCIKINPYHAASLYELALLHIGFNDYDQAFIYIKRAAEIDKNNKWYKSLLASFYDKKGEYQKSAKLYEEINQIDPNSLENIDKWAMALIYSNDFKKAIEVYDKLEERVGINEHLSIQKHKLYVATKNEKGAEEEFLKLIKSDPNNSKYHRLLADYYLNSEREKEALEEYNKVLALDSTDAYINLSLYEYYTKKNNKVEAQKQLEKSFKNPNLIIDAKVRLYLEQYFTLSGVKQGKEKEGMKMGKYLTETHPDEAKSFAVYGDFLYRLDSLKLARENFRKSIALDESKHLVWTNLILIESDLQDFDAMYSESSKAIELFPTQPSFYLFKGMAAVQKKKYPEAIEALEAGKELVFNLPKLSAQFYATLGDAYNAQKQYEKSDNAYEKSLEYDPNNTYVLNNYSYYLSLRKEKLEKAAEMSKKSNELQPNSPSFQDTYAWILFQQKKYDEAFEWVEKAISNGGDKSPVILEHKGDILFFLNKKDEAQEYWKKAKEIGKGSENLEQKIIQKKFIE